MRASAYTLTPTTMADEATTGAAPDSQPKKLDTPAQKAEEFLRFIEEHGVYPETSDDIEAGIVHDKPEELWEAVEGFVLENSKTLEIAAKEVTGLKEAVQTLEEHVADLEVVIEEKKVAITHTGEDYISVIINGVEYEEITGVGKMALVAIAHNPPPPNE